MYDRGEHLTTPEVDDTLPQDLSPDEILAALEAVPAIDSAIILGCQALHDTEVIQAKPDLTALPNDPREVVDTIRQWYRTTGADMTHPPLGTYGAMCGYLSRLKINNNQLYRTIQRQLGEARVATSLTYILGPLFHHDANPTGKTADTVKRMQSGSYDAVASAFMTDVLAIDNLGEPDPGAKAAYLSPEHYVPKTEAADPSEPATEPEIIALAAASKQTRQHQTRIGRRNERPQNDAPTANSVSFYIRNAKHITESLEFDEEQALGEDVTLGRIAQHKLNENTYKPEEKAQLEQQIATAKHAQKMLVESRLDLVVAIARLYSHNRASLLDLVQDGNLGLMRAAQEFNPNKGAFSTYAKGWVKKYIMESMIYKYPLIYVPDSHLRAIKKMCTFIDAFAAENRRNPTQEEIMAGTGIKSRQFISAWETSSYRYVQSTDRVITNTDVVSSGSLTLDDITPDRRAIEPEIVAIHTKDPLMNLIHEALEAAGDPQLGIILALNYGLDLGPSVLTPEFIAEHNIKPGEPYTLRQIAPMINTSHPTIYRRNNKILELLREKIKESPELAELFFRN